MDACVENVAIEAANESIQNDLTTGEERGRRGADAPRHTDVPDAVTQDAGSLDALEMPQAENQQRKIRGLAGHG